jgi:galactokinase
MSHANLQVSAPGRICLLGEHQDYFGLAIIAGAIDLRIMISGKKRKDKFFKIELPDIDDREEFLIGKEIPYNRERDYIKSAFNVLQRKGIQLSSGWDCLIKGNIPINSGTASSSSLVIAWIRFLLEAANDERAALPDKIAELGFLAEVTEFEEPGGKMDHYSSSLGSITVIHFGKEIKVKKFKNPLKGFVLADSLQKKDTKGILGFIKKHVLFGVSEIQKTIKSFNLESPLDQNVKDEIEKLTPPTKDLLKGTLLTRELTAEGVTLFESEVFDHERFGQLLYQQHKILRDYLHISTPKIEQMIEASLEAGAFGAKINGSGGGGCIFAYAPQKIERVAETLEKTGARVYKIKIDEGARKDL